MEYAFVRSPEFASGGVCALWSRDHGGALTLRRAGADEPLIGVVESVAGAAQLVQERTRWSDLAATAEGEVEEHAAPPAVVGSAACGGMQSSDERDAIK